MPGLMEADRVHKQGGGGMSRGIENPLGPKAFRTLQ